MAFALAFALALPLLAGAEAGPRDYTNYNFEAYLSEFGKTYEAAEHQKRRAIFEENLAQVVAHNREYAGGNHTWYAAANRFADWTPEEFRALQTAKYRPTRAAAAPAGVAAGAHANPEAVDWRTKGAVTKVKDQGGCGSCWAFAAVETVESHYFLASGELLELSAQTYVNCVKNPHECGGTGGCEGATFELAYNLTASSGVASEADLPYAEQDMTCSPYKAAVTAAGYVQNPANDAGALETAIATKGPVAITVAASPWMFYHGGVFHGCSRGLFSHTGAELNHGVQAVGYTQEYWIVRNSWGADWGEGGYIRVSRASDAKTFVDKKPQDGVACKPFPKTQSVGGECGMLFDTSYPTGVAAATSTVVV